MARPVADALAAGGRGPRRCAASRRRLHAAARHSGRRDGALVAVRDETGGCRSLVRRRASNYDLERWLEHDGDERTAKERDAARFRAMRSAASRARQGRDGRRSHTPPPFADDCRMPTSSSRSIVHARAAPAAGGHRLLRRRRRAPTRSTSSDEASSGSERSPAREAVAPVRARPRTARRRYRTPARAGRPKPEHVRDRPGRTGPRCRGNPISSGASAPRAGPGCRPGRGRRCAS